MKQKVSVDKLLHTMDHEGCYLTSLTLTPEEDRILKTIRKEIRSALRAGFTGWRTSPPDIIPPEYRDIVKRLKPKFLTQGSYAYETINRPACAPPQQIDLDYGVYFPMSFVEGSPVMAKNILLQMVDEILMGYAQSKGYTYSRKATCGRIEVGNGHHIHVDIPVYAIPDNRHEEIVESMEARAVFGAVDLSEPHYRLNPDEVYLALRTEEHWTISDPMEIYDWFKDWAKHFQRLRRICRYVKGWRDFQWKKGGPSSIALMAAVVETFTEQINATGENFTSDSEALLAVVRALPDQLSGNIINPANDKNELLFPRGHSQPEIDEIVRHAERFKINIEQALCGKNAPALVITFLGTAFGPRIPNRPEWVEQLPEDTVSVVTSTSSTLPAAPTNYRSG